MDVNNSWCPEFVFNTGIEMCIFPSMFFSGVLCAPKNNMLITVISFIYLPFIDGDAIISGNGKAIDFRQFQMKYLCWQIWENRKFC